FTCRDSNDGNVHIFRKAGYIRIALPPQNFLIFGVYRKNLTLVSFLAKMLQRTPVNFIKVSRGYYDCNRARIEQTLNRLNTGRSGKTYLRFKLLKIHLRPQKNNTNRVCYPAFFE